MSTPQLPVSSRKVDGDVETVAQEIVAYCRVSDPYELAERIVAALPPSDNRVVAVLRQVRLDATAKAAKTAGEGWTFEHGRISAVREVEAALVSSRKGEG